MAPVEPRAPAARNAAGALVEILVQLVELVDPSPRDDRDATLLHIDRSRRVLAGGWLLREDAVAPEQVDVAPERVRGGVGHRQGEHHVRMRAGVGGRRAHGLWQMAPLPPVRARPFESRLARLAEGDADGHVLRLAHVRPAPLPTAPALAALALALARVLVQCSRVEMERLPVGQVAVVVVPLALDAHLEELLDALVHGRVHGRLAALLRQLPPGVAIVHNQVPITVAPVGVSEAVASDAGVRLVPGFEEPACVVAEQAVLADRERLVVVRVARVRGLVLTRVMYLLDETLVDGLRTPVACLPRIGRHDEAR